MDDRESVRLSMKWNQFIQECYRLLEFFYIGFYCRRKHVLHVLFQ